MAGRCAVTATLRPFAGWLVEGAHGERLAFGVNVVVGPSMVLADACPGFRDAVLAAFGPGGPRRLTAQVQDAWQDEGDLRGFSFDPRFLGPNPGAENWEPFPDMGTMRPTGTFLRGRR